MIEHVALALSFLLNAYLWIKRPHRHVKVYPHPEARGVWVHKLKTRKKEK